MSVRGGETITSLAGSAVAYETGKEMLKGAAAVAEAIANSPDLLEAAQRTIETLSTLDSTEKMVLAAGAAVTLAGVTMGARYVWKNTIGRLPQRMREEFAVHMPVVKHSDVLKNVFFGVGADTASIRRKEDMSAKELAELAAIRDEKDENFWSKHKTRKKKRVEIPENITNPTLRTTDLSRAERALIGYQLRDTESYRADGRIEESLKAGATDRDYMEKMAKKRGVASRKR